MTGLTLRPPRGADAVPTLDAHQHAAVEAALRPGSPGHAGHVVIVGPAGSGRTTVAAAVAVEAARRGTDVSRLLVLAATRDAAARLRDRVSLLLDRPVGAPVVRTAASAAHAVLAARAAAAGDPPPVLVTGAEQDQILRELLAGHARGIGARPDWAGVIPEDATRLPGFRAELRDLLMRASEAGLAPDDLAALGRDVGRPEWAAAAVVMAEYDEQLLWRALTPDQGARYDPAVVVAQAAAALRAGDAPAPPWDLVIVDDAQDLTAAGRSLLEALAARGARLVLLGNADQSVQGYRGAMPTILADAVGPGWLGATLVRLGPGHRQSGALASVTAATVGRIGVLGEGSARTAVEPVPAAGEVRILTAAHRHAHSRAVAAELRAARHGDGTGPQTPWGSMAVIARSTGRLRELRADLAAMDIPCETLGEGTALHREPAIAPLLTMMRRAAAVARGEAEPWEEDAAAELLGSRLIGLDPVALRRLRRALVRQERLEEGHRSSGELLTAALDDATLWAGLATPEARAAARATRAIAAGAAAAALPDATPGAIGWAVWEALGVAEAWRAAALAGSARDDADLDAVIALLKAAQFYAERMPGSSVTSFIEHLEGQEFAVDSLGARARALDTVSFATPAGAAGREWDVVVVAGLEEGVWPDLRLRDSVLGAQHLADVLAGRAERAPIPEAGRAAAARSARRAVLDDETRAFAVAASRARRRLILTCVDGDDERPSRFLAWAGAAAQVSAERADAAPPVADLRAAVAAVRAEAAALPAADRDGHARLLARLTRLEIAGADPDDWHGVPGPSTEVGMWDEDMRIRVSPSRLESLETCPLRWALESVGGQAASSEKQSLGTLVHEIAAELPAGTHDQLAAALDARWSEMGGGGTWPDLLLRERADGMIRRLAGYVASVHCDEVRVEEGFGVEVGRAYISGSADRVEIAGGEARIVDLKTGTAVSKDAAQEHAQLAMYQLAAAHGAFRGVDGASGASLVYVGGATQGASPRDQDPIDVEKETVRLADAVDQMARATFRAQTNERCGSCPVRRSCPAWPSGRQVTDG
ncbi:UrvD/REP family ATP-dependent DNA helicase [Demequina pelophila]|uniref:UrvD/REP family ATP-dependent DNA helicase n=1 Tax=Demequina pelophila TaxID=1638984 RepID=UPI00078259B0|nr:UrvD/REP family ATP-dependent DNA helicase [Demequina pelophila]